LISPLELSHDLHHQCNNMQVMKTVKFACCTIFLFIMNCSLYAQSKGTITAKKIIEKGSEGDITLGQKNKKDQLNNPPIILHQRDLICGKDILRSSKKFRRNQNKKGS
jgi:hypothetical protein